MTAKGRADVTLILGEIRAGDGSAKTRLFEAVYSELQRIAGGLMRGERADHTLQPTALVNEAAIRLIGRDELAKLRNRRHFYSAAAEAMRRILVDHARAHGAGIRGGSAVKIPLSDEHPAKAELDIEDEVWLDDALRRLEALNPRMAEVVMLRRYGGLQNKGIAELLDLSLRTIEADFTAAKSWLLGEIRKHSCG